MPILLRDGKLLYKDNAKLLYGEECCCGEKQVEYIYTCCKECVPPGSGVEEGKLPKRIRYIEAILERNLCSIIDIDENFLGWQPDIYIVSPYPGFTTVLTHHFIADLPEYLRIRWFPFDAPYCGSIWLMEEGDFIPPHKCTHPLLSFFGFPPAPVNGRSRPYQIALFCTDENVLAINGNPCYPSSCMMEMFCYVDDVDESGTGSSPYYCKPRIEDEIIPQRVPVISCEPFTTGIREVLGPQVPKMLYPTGAWVEMCEDPIGPFFGPRYSWAYTYVEEA